MDASLGQTATSNAELLETLDGGVSELRGQLAQLSSTAASREIVGQQLASLQDQLADLATKQALGDIGAMAAAVRRDLDELKDGAASKAQLQELQAAADSKADLLDELKAAVEQQAADLATLKEELEARTRPPFGALSPAAWCMLDACVDAAVICLVLVPEFGPAVLTVVGRGWP